MELAAISVRSPRPKAFTTVFSSPKRSICNGDERARKARPTGTARISAAGANPTRFFAPAGFARRYASPFRASTSACGTSKYTDASTTGTTSSTMGAPFGAASYVTSVMTVRSSPLEMMAAGLRRNSNE